MLSFFVGLAMWNPIISTDEKNQNRTRYGHKTANFKPFFTDSTLKNENIPLLPRSSELDFPGDGDYIVLLAFPPAIENKDIKKGTEYISLGRAMMQKQAEFALEVIDKYGDVTLFLAAYSSVDQV
jgi:hypothetical protein